jgi:uncharacterized protein YggE
MTETTISVQGQHSASYDPERATVAITVAFDGPHRNPVVSSATSALEAVRATVLERCDAEAGPITRWSAESVRVWAERPWNNEGRQLDPVHHASLDLQAEFADFEALGVWIELVVAMPGTSIGGITWTLTEATRAAALTEVRSLAVKDAVAKAGVYATSIGLSTVSPIALADPGMLGDGPSSASAGFPAPERMMMAKFDAAGSPALALRPERIELSAAVDARFTAR